MKIPKELSLIFLPFAGLHKVLSLLLSSNLLLIYDIIGGLICGLLLVINVHEINKNAAS